jgi:hypothetical protein
VVRQTTAPWLSGSLVSASSTGLAVIASIARRPANEPRISRTSRKTPRRPRVIRRGLTRKAARGPPVRIAAATSSVWPSGYFG